MDDSQNRGSRPIPYEIAYARTMLTNVHREPPPVLFHYTDAAGLRGIVTSGKLWASHVHYLNDTEELRYATTVILRRFDTKITESSPSAAARIMKLRDTYKGHTDGWQSVADPYVVCFCEHGNLLSQWRAYAANGQGFALGFAPDPLMTAVHSDPNLRATSKLFRVLYDENEQLSFVDLAIDQLLEAFDTHDEVEVLQGLPVAFSEMSFCFKHPAFSEEREWRLVCVAQPSMKDLINVRESGGRLLPYAAIRMCQGNERPPYVKVSYGPTLEAQNTRKAVEILLGKAHPNHWNEIAISGSDAPLRSR